MKPPAPVTNTLVIGMILLILDYPT
jgi:hypothetical protein